MEYKRGIVKKIAASKISDAPHRPKGAVGGFSFLKQVKYNSKFFPLQNPSNLYVLYLLPFRLLVRSLYLPNLKDWVNLVICTFYIYYRFVCWFVIFTKS